MPGIKTLFANKWFAVFFSILLFVINGAVGESFLAAEARKLENRQREEMLAFASALRARVEREINALLYLNSGLGSYLVVRRDSLQEDELHAIMRRLHESASHVRNFGVAVGHRLTYVYPRAGNEQAIGLYYPDVSEQWPVIERLIAVRQPALAGPIDLVQGGRGLIYRVPLLVEGEYWGLLSTVIDADSLFADIFSHAAPGRFDFSLRGREVLGLEGRPIHGDQRLFREADSLVQAIEVPGGVWEVAVTAGEAAAGNGLQGLRLLILVVAAVIAGLIYMVLMGHVELSRLVMYDTLTGLPNRRLLEDRYDMAALRRRRRPAQWDTLLFLDLDGFKEINDGHGHKAGDAVLKTVAQRIRGLVRANDTVARWGGDEFILLLEDTSPGQTHELVSRLRRAVDSPIPFEGRGLRVTTSIGQTDLGPGDSDIDTALKEADQRMYADKVARKGHPPRP